jgi:all-trans-retinol 13,14-reductase
VLVFTDWEAFRPWQDSTLGRRPEGYSALKEAIGRQLLAQFTRHFPALASMIVCHEVSTPLTIASYIGSEHGAVYGLEHTARRLWSDSLRPTTPVPGLYLAGQDVFTAGVMGAMTGGVLAAAAIDPRVFSHLE